MAQTPAQPVPKFVEGDWILCFHGSLIYEAQCLKFRASEKGKYEYWIHYVGWNKNWDEWVPETRILKYNEKNVARQKYLESQLIVAPKKAKGGKKGRRQSSVKDAKPGDARSEGSVHDPDSRSLTPSVDGKSRGKTSKVPLKRKETTPPSSSVFEEVYAPTKKMKNKVIVSEILFSKNAVLSNLDYDTVEIPTNLLNWLAKDWYHVIKLKRLVNLPAPISVVEMLKDYQDYLQAIYPRAPALKNQLLAKQMEEIFSRSLHAFLLFKCERQQYKDMRLTHPYKPIPQIYGAHHFLRLFSKSRQLFKCVSVEAFKDLIQFLSASDTKYFNTHNYGIAPPE